MAKKLSPSLDKILDSLMNEVVIGKAHLVIGKGLQKIDPAVRQTAQVFFDFTLIGHLEMSQMYAAKLFDKHRKAITIESMLRTAEGQLSGFQFGNVGEIQDAIGRSKRRVAQLEPILKSLRRRRNEYLAHLAPDTVHDSTALVKHANLTTADLDSIFSEAGLILNEVKNLRNGMVSITDLVDSEDYTNALKLIADAKCAQIRELEAKYGEKWTALHPRGCD